MPSWCLRTPKGRSTCIRSSSSSMIVMRSLRVCVRSASCSVRNLCRCSSAANSSRASGLTRPSCAELSLGILQSPALLRAVEGDGSRRPRPSVDARRSIAEPADRDHIPKPECLRRGRARMRPARPAGTWSRFSWICSSRLWTLSVSPASRSRVAASWPRSSAISALTAVRADSAPPARPAPARRTDRWSRAPSAAARRPPPRSRAARDG